MTKAEHIMEKLSALTGAHLDKGELPATMLDKLPEYLKDKSKEKPTSIPVAAAGGAAIGGTVGYLSALDYKNKLPLTLLIGGLGALTGAALAGRDEDEIEAAKRILAKKQLLD